MEEFKREPLTVDEQQDLVRSCTNLNEKLVVYTLLDTGLRVSEFCGLKKENIDWVTHDLIFRGKGKRKGQKEGQGGKRRVVRMTKRVQMVLEPYIRANDRILFGKRTVQRIVETLAQRAMIQKECTPHVLRHSFAVNCLRNGIPITVVKKLLGHADLNMTLRYLNMAPEEELRTFTDRFVSVE